MKWFVVDASVTIKAITQKKSLLSKKFFQLQQQALDEKAYLFSPPIFWVECANALRFSTKEEKKNQAYLQEIFALPIRLTQPTAPSIARALKMSHNLGDTVYDTWYHMTALWLGATYITADKKYFNKAKDIGQIRYWGD